MNVSDNKLAELCIQYEVLDLYVFGSRAKEIQARIHGRPFSCAASETSESDVDFGVLPKDATSWGIGKKVDFAAALEDLCRVRRVDLVVLPEADPFLAADIISGELLYTSDPDRQARYELYVLRRAGDLLPFKKDRVRKIFEEGAR